VAAISERSVYRREFSTATAPPCRHLLGEAHVVRGEPPAGLGADQRHRADGAAAGPHRDHHQRAHPHGPEQAQVLFVDRGGGQQLVGDVGEELRLTRSQHRREPLGGIGVDRLVLTQALGQHELLGVGMSHDDLTAHAAVVDQLDPAPVGDLGHREPGHVTQRLAVVERRGKDLADSGEEPRLALGALGGGHVLDDRHRRLDVPVCVVQRSRLEHPPLLGAARRLDEAEQQRLGRQPPKQSH
jgi:hypothetical protein